VASTFSELIDETFRRLGDKQYIDTATTSVADLAAVKKQLNSSIRRDLLRTYERAGVSPLAGKIEFSIGKDYPVQVLTVTGAPTGGTFIIKLANASTSAMTYDESASDIQTALRLIDPFTTDTLVVMGSAGGPWTLTWPATSDRQNIPPVTIDARLLTGGTSPDVSVTAAATGSIQNEIHVDHYFRTTAGVANLRGGLYVERVMTGGSIDRVPCSFPYGGQQSQEFRYRGVFPWATGLVNDMAGDTFYFRGSYMGLIDTPSEAKDYRAYYTPQYTPLVNDSPTVGIGDTLVTIGLRVFVDYEDIPPVSAAMTLLADKNSQQYALLAAEFRRLMMEFKESVYSLGPNFTGD